MNKKVVVISTSIRANSNSEVLAEKFCRRCIICRKRIENLDRIRE